MNAKSINKLLAIANKKKYAELFENVGVRIVDEDYLEYNARKGDTLPNSHTWEDGEYTDVELDGTSCIDNGEHGTFLGEYFGDKALIIGGDFATWGDDPGERLIQNAVVLAVFDEKDIQDL